MAKPTNTDTPAGPSHIAAQFSPEPEQPDPPKDSDPANAWQGSFAAFSQIFQQLKKNPQPLLLVVVAYGVLALLSTLFGTDPVPRDKHYASYEDILTLVFLMAMPVYGLALADKRSISISQFINFTPGRYLRVFAVSVLTFFVILIPGLLIVPLVWTVAWFSLSVYPAIDKKMEIIQAMKESKRLAQNHKGKVWSLFGVTLLLFLPILLMQSVPVIGPVYSGVIVVLISGAQAKLYRWLLQQPAETTIPVPTPTQNN